MDNKVSESKTYSFYDLERDYREPAYVFRALNSPLRLKILSLLNERDHYVFELVDELKSSQPLISQHLRVLKQSDLIDCERVGRQMIYRLTEPRVLELMKIGFDIVDE